MRPICKPNVPVTAVLRREDLLLALQNSLYLEFLEKNAPSAS